MAGANDGAYYDYNQDGTMNIFPDGDPKTRPHAHYVINQDGGVTYMREKNGEIVNQYRDRLPDGTYYNG